MRKAQWWGSDSGKIRNLFGAGSRGNDHVYAALVLFSVFALYFVDGLLFLMQTPVST